MKPPNRMHDFEKLGLFYLGRRFDPAAQRVLDEPVLYDARDLVTHAVCVGMTGSGKTGLCIALIEEAALDGVPVIAIDPKGDLGNLLLTFPRLAAEDFRPWIDDNAARRAGRSADEQAEEEASRWRQGLLDSDQDGARIERLRRAADFAIYTPGSRAGRAVSILASLAAPPVPDRTDAEALGERAGQTAASLLALAGADPAPRTREHTLLASVLAARWREGRSFDLGGLIAQVQTPPFEKIGVMDLGSFFPERDRFELATRLNGLLAAPGFERWLTGEPLDPAALLHTREGRPRVAIFSIAHLADPERMFFVSLLLNQMVTWMRSQTGTTSLRAIVYMDEIVGYFPPVADPPSKGPLLTLLKQGRAFGLGVVLATQNPVDLDYKGLSNTGTWFLGRLQTERDKERVLDGLEGASGGSLERAEADRLLSGLGKRVFLLHNVHETGPIVFQTRWTMSYLRGPLSRQDIVRIGSEAVESADRAPVIDSTEAVPSPAASVPQRTVVPPGIQQFFVPLGKATPAAVVYEPVILGAGRVRFMDAKLGVREERDVLYATEVVDGPVPVDWTQAKRLDHGPADLEQAPVRDAAFAPVPDAALKPKSYVDWQKAFTQWLAHNESLHLLTDPELGLTSRPGEEEGQFRVRLQAAQRERRDAAVESLRRKYAPREQRLSEQLRRAESAVARESEQASHAKLQTAVSMGATLLGALLGRKGVGTGTLGRATTAARGVGRSMKESEDIKRATQNVDAVRAQIAELEEQLEREMQAIAERFAAERPLERIALLPKRGHASTLFVALGWVPRQSGGRA